MGSVLAHEDDPRVTEVRRRLDEYYNSATDYQDFIDQTDKTSFWAPIMGRIREQLVAQGSCRVLEFGAGRTEFGDYVAGAGPGVEFHVQDVTRANVEHLRTQSDHVLIGDLKGSGSKFDVIFSTFVWEHVTDPGAVFEHLFGMLSPGGTLFIACPRYDLPGYLPPSARHYGKARQWALNVALMFRRLWTRLTGRPGFWIHVDPAIFHRKWYIDADAIHWVSLYDLRAVVRGRGVVKRLDVPAAKGGLKYRIKHLIWRRMLLLFVRIDKHAASGG